MIPRRRIASEIQDIKGEDPPQDISEMDRGPLISELRNYLQQKRYVFMFDDVWNIHFWDEIEHALSDNKNGSRNMDVAMHCKKSSFIELHTLQPLTEEQSFELFNKKAFRFDFDGCCPKELIEISFEIARKCKGLPLAIVAIGGLLSTKEKNAFELQRFSENMTLELNKDSHLTGIKPILGFSYDDLPFHLKSCLLYFGMYPEDYKVESKRLIWQWIAEGFVKEEKGSTLEEVAEGYLTELIRPSLVQVSSVRIDGKTKCCSVHDLIRITVLEKCEELSFCKRISEVSHSSSSEITRRLSGATNSVVESIEKPCVRSLFLFKSISNESINLDKYLVRRMMKKYRRLKVLDLQDAMLLIVHENLGSFIHLKYLSFRNSVSARRQRKLPKSIGMLQNLETIDLRAMKCHCFN